MYELTLVLKDHLRVAMFDKRCGKIQKTALKQVQQSTEANINQDDYRQ